MNSKAIRKQLLAAVAMVLVAAVALSSSTYAWFVASGTVKAEGMKVQAQTDGNLVIRYKGTEWVSVATAGMDDVRGLKPTSTKDLVKWVWAKAEKSDASTADDKTFEDKSTLVRPNTWGKDDADSDSNCKDSDFALVKYFQIRAASSSSTPMGLYVPAITVTGATNTMSTALRVGVECRYKTGTGDTTATRTKIFAPVTLSGGGSGNEPTRTYQVMVPTTTGSGTTFARSADFTVATIGDTNETTNDTTNAVIVPSTVGIGSNTADAVDVYVYVWLEGEDGNLKSDNFYADELSVSVEFTSIDPVAGA